MDSSNFISSPRGRGRVDYAGFVYVRFAIGNLLNVPQKWQPDVQHLELLEEA
jgi:hypothetical protein